MQTDNVFTSVLDSWNPPSGMLRIRTLDCHTEGEPLRIITGGMPELRGDTILKRRRFMLSELDHLRKILMWEPRGHADMYGCIVTRPVSPDAAFGVLFLHNEGYSTMCGHGIIGVAMAAVETGLVDCSNDSCEFGIDTPAGIVRPVVRKQSTGPPLVSFRNVASFAHTLDGIVKIPGLGKVTFDLAFGGAFYAFVDATSVGLTCTPKDFAALVDVGMRIKNAVAEAVEIDHPKEKDLEFLYGTIFTGPSEDPAHHSRHVCVFAEGEVDRSPTGTGVSARAAILSARGALRPKETIVIESIIGSTFGVTVVESQPFGKYDAIIPEVAGSAFITGKHTFLVDVDDPLRTGFVLR